MSARELPYDPAVRRDTPLARKIAGLIERRGALAIREFMSLCLTDSEHGYYVRRDAIGRRGDFITAPEISQVFGEIVGLWAAVVWQQMGAPATFTLIELGPGRGTMMKDALRAASKVPGFLSAADVLLVERNERLRKVQEATLAGVPARVRHVTSPAAGEETPAGPTIVLANEFLDTIPVSQFAYATVSDADGAWHERAVTLDPSGRLQFAIGRRIVPRPEALAQLAMPRPGDIVEQRDYQGIIGRLTRPASTHPVAALFIDYGHDAPSYGDTLQAVRDHRTEHPLTSPGEADLTAHVDFAAFAADLGRARVGPGAATLIADGPVTQAEFLGRLGAVERASRLMAANAARAAEIEFGIARLIAVPGMGNRFKVIGVRTPGVPPLPGF